jgi:hypothetical protein
MITRPFALVLLASQSCVMNEKKFIEVVIMNGEWAMGNGEWSMGNDQWSMGNDQWSMVNGQW